MPNTKKSVNFSVRLEPDLIDQLTKEAKESGESRNAIIVRKLKSALGKGEIQSLIDFVGGEKNLALLLALSIPMFIIEISGRAKWYESPYTADQIKQAFCWLVDRLGPDGDPNIPKDINLPEEFLKHLGLSYSLGALEDIRKADTTALNADQEDRYGGTWEKPEVERWIKLWMGDEILKRLER